MTVKEFKKVVVVGDRLKTFGSHDKAITISELEKLIEQIAQRQTNEKYLITIGQGIQEKRIKNLCEKLSILSLSDKFTIKVPSTFKRSNRYLTHKHKSKNIVISELIKVSDKQYECTLMIDDRMAEMSDHTTGEHIQSMVLIEAARQMVIAVCEKYYISKENKSKISFVTNNTDSSFHEFVFPLPVLIRYEVLEIKKFLNSNLTSKAKISFIQNKKTCVEIIFKFSAISTQYLSSKESFLAQKSINDYLNSEIN